MTSVSNAYLSQVERGLHEPSVRVLKAIANPARRRLLGMLLVLAIASGALAYTRMAAWWVVVPSTVMLLGYLALLYEAGKADAERRELARTRATAAAAAADTRA